MIGLDTNIVLRLLVEDDQNQTDAIVQWLKNNSSVRDTHFISDIVLVETVWTLRRAYQFSRSEIANALLQLFLNAIFKFERDDETMFSILQRFSSNRVDLSDILIATKATEHGCPFTVSFDKAAIKAGIMEAII